MGESIYLCQQCGNAFRLDSVNGHPSEGDLSCPRCGQSQIKELPSWVPTGVASGEDPGEWEYQCQQCHDTFKRPVPESPSQERVIRCPSCNSGHIHRLTAAGYAPLYCG